MSTETKIREAFEKYADGCEQYFDEVSFSAGYMTGMAEAFEAAAKEVETSSQDFSRADYAAAIREMAKENGK